MADSTALDSKFTCRRCRAVLFTSADLVAHAAETGDGLAGKKRQFSGKKWGEQNFAVAGQGRPGDTECTSYFLADAPAWAMGGTGGIDSGGGGGTGGKLTCPNAKCKSRVGTLSWGGAQCSCGSWVVPSVQFPKSKVDERMSAAATAAAAAAVEEAAAVEAAAAEKAAARAAAEKADGRSSQSMSDMIYDLQLKEEQAVAAAAAAAAEAAAEAQGFASAVVSYNRGAVEERAALMVKARDDAAAAAAAAEQERARVAALAPLAALVSSGMIEHFPSMLAQEYGAAFGASARGGMEALLAPDVQLLTPRGASSGADAALNALLVSRARMTAGALRVGEPRLLSPESAEVTFSFASKAGATVVMADVLTVQRKLVVSIVRRKV
jgi:hypothetical protein